MKKRKVLCAISFALIALVSAPLSVAADETQPVVPGEGSFSGQFKGLYVLDGKNNGYDPNDGAAYLALLKYQVPITTRLQMGLGGYVAGDFLGMTDFNSERVARGLFVTDDGGSDGVMGEAYLQYKGEGFALEGGRMLYRSPLTTSASSTIPNFYTAFGLSSTAFDSFTLGLTQVTQIAFGARAMTDFGLIGEGTRSGGVAVNASQPGLGQARFHAISKATLGASAPDTNGMTVFHLGYSGIERGGVDLWNYYVDEIANNIYLEGHKIFPLAEGKRLRLQGQLLHQRDLGDSLAGDLDYTLLGLQATLMGKGWSLFGSANHSSGSSEMLNGWGGDPAYTSTVFSRNAYREKVTAFKVGGRYAVNDKLSLMAAYAHYGQSETPAPLRALRAGSSGMATPRSDADEFNLVLTYRVQKGLAVNLLHARRTSEYDGTNGRDLTQAHSRLVVNYTF